MGYPVAAHAERPGTAEPAAVRASPRSDEGRWLRLFLQNPPFFEVSLKSAETALVFSDENQRKFPDPFTRSVPSHPDRRSTQPIHAMALLFSANSLAMVAPNLTCAASRTHSRRAQPARPTSGPPRHRAAHRLPQRAQCLHTRTTSEPRVGAPHLRLITRRTDAATPSGYPARRT